MPGPNADVNRLAQASHFFRVTIPDDGTGPKLTAMFKTVRGLSRSFELEAIPEGGRIAGQRALPRGPAKYGQVTLENGLVGYDALWAWSRQVNSGVPYRRDVTIEHLEPGTERLVQIYHLDGAWPVSWSLSDFDAGPGASLSMVTIQLAFDDLRVGQETPRKTPLKATLTTLEGPEIKVILPVNPTELVTNREVQWKGVETPHMAYPTLAVSTGQLDKLKVDHVTVDGGDGSVDVAELIDRLHKMTAPVKIPGWAQDRPPKILFDWNTTRFEGGVSSLATHVTALNEDGRPMRAIISFELSGQLQGGGQKYKVEVQRNRVEAAAARTPPADLGMSGED